METFVFNMQDSTWSLCIQQSNLSYSCACCIFVQRFRFNFSRKSTWWSWEGLFQNKHVTDWQHSPSAPCFWYSSLYPQLDKYPLPVPSPSGLVLPFLNESYGFIILRSMIQVQLASTFHCCHLLFFLPVPMGLLFKICFYYSFSETSGEDKIKCMYLLCHLNQRCFPAICTNTYHSANRMKQSEC